MLSIDERDVILKMEEHMNNIERNSERIADSYERIATAFEKIAGCVSDDRGGLFVPEFRIRNVK